MPDNLVFDMETPVYFALAIVAATVFLTARAFRKPDSSSSDWRVGSWVLRDGDYVWVYREDENRAV